MEDGMVSSRFQCVLTPLREIKVFKAEGNNEA